MVTLEKVTSQLYIAVFIGILPDLATYLFRIGKEEKKVNVHLTAKRRIPP